MYVRLYTYGPGPAARLWRGAEEDELETHFSLNKKTKKKERRRTETGPWSWTSGELK